MRLYRISLDIRSDGSLTSLEPKLEIADDVERELLLLRLAFEEQKKCKECHPTSCEGCNLQNIETYLNVLKHKFKEKTVDEINSLL